MGESYEGVGKMNHYTRQEKVEIHIERQPVDRRSEDSVYMTEKRKSTPAEGLK